MSVNVCRVNAHTDIGQISFFTSRASLSNNVPRVFRRNRIGVLSKAIKIYSACLFLRTNRTREFAMTDRNYLTNNNSANTCDVKCYYYHVYTRNHLFVI